MNDKIAFMFFLPCLAQCGEISLVKMMVWMPCGGLLAKLRSWSWPQWTSGILYGSWMHFPYLYRYFCSFPRQLILKKQISQGITSYHSYIFISHRWIHHLHHHKHLWDKNIINSGMVIHRYHIIINRSPFPLLQSLKPQAPSIIFIDEIDAIGRKRGKGGFTGGAWWGEGTCLNRYDIIDNDMIT